MREWVQFTSHVVYIWFSFRHFWDQRGYRLPCDRKIGSYNNKKKTGRIGAKNRAQIRTSWIDSIDEWDETCPSSAKGNGRWPQGVDKRAKMPVLSKCWPISWKRRTVADDNLLQTRANTNSSRPQQLICICYNWFAVVTRKLCQPVDEHNYSGLPLAALSQINLTTTTLQPPLSLSPHRFSISKSKHNSVPKPKCYWFLSQSMWPAI